MSTSLIPSNPTDMLAIAKQMAVSGFFQDARKAEEAFVKIMAGAELGLPPFQAMTGIHVISGKPVLGAGLIASIIKRSGKYTYRVPEQNEKVCTVEIVENGEIIGTSTFTIEMAKKAGVKNLEKFPQNMLFARAISNAAKWYCPDVFGGPVYTDGEIEREPVQETTAEVVEAKVVEAKSYSKREVAEAMKAQQERADKARKEFELMFDADNYTTADYDVAEDTVFRDERLPEAERKGYVKELLLKRIGACVSAEDANYILSRIRIWTPTLGKDNAIALANDLTEQGGINGFRMYDTGKKNAKGGAIMAYAPVEEPETVEADSLPY